MESMRSALIGQCLAESLGGGIYLREKIDLWLLKIHCKTCFIILYILKVLFL